MTTKNAGKPPEVQPGVGPSQQELQAAYQVHTLAHMLYGQVAPSHPWIHHVSPMGMGTIDPTMGQMAPSHPWIQPVPPMGMGTVDPAMSPMAAPWAQSWPASCCNTVGRMGPSSYPWMGPTCYFGPDVFPR